MGAKKQRKVELETHRSKLQEQHFKSMCYGNKAFEPDIEAYHHDQPCGIPRDKKVENLNAYPHEAPFRPSQPTKKGFNGTLEPFPEHIPDPVPAPPGRRPPPAEDAPPAWRPGCPRQVTNPMPSVMTSLRNLRCEHPRSFTRPCL